MLGDTIQAVASPRGASVRGVLRVSGPAAFTAVGRLIGCAPPRRRGAIEGTLEVCGQPVEALLLTMPGPASYTGEDVVELHLPGSPLLLQLIGSALAPEVRAALPGEFTRRAFETGKLDLVQAEAVAALIASASVDDSRRALQLLRGGLGEGIVELRESLLDARAWIEAGLDFEASETGAVDESAWLPLLVTASRRVDELQRELPRTIPGGDLLLVGRANAGKSSLANALADRDAVIVTPVAGTTRDVIAVELDGGLRILDAPGELDAGSAIDRSAIELRDRLAVTAGAALLVVDPSVPARLPDSLGLTVAAIVATRADLGIDPAWLRDAAGVIPLFLVGCPNRVGIDALRRFLSALPHGPDSRGSHTATVLTEVRAAIDGALEHGRVGQAELAAVDLAIALEQLRTLDGAQVGDAVLDRIFGRFCLGK